MNSSPLHHRCAAVPFPRKRGRKELALFLPSKAGEVGTRPKVGWSEGVILLSVILVACSPAPDRLINPSDIQADALKTPLTEVAGDPERGLEVFTNRERGHCILCHHVENLPDEFQGNIGPALSGVGDRLSAAQIRLRIVDYEKVKPGTLMPSYYRTYNLHQVGATYKGQTILSAQDIEDLVAYLEALK